MDTDGVTKEGSFACLCCGGESRSIEAEYELEGQAEGSFGKKMVQRLVGQMMNAAPPSKRPKRTEPQISPS